MRIGGVTHGPYQSIGLSESGGSLIAKPVADGDRQDDSNSTSEWKVDTSGEPVMAIGGPVYITTEYDPLELPYWYMITPLTLLSAYLLLWPARRSKPPTDPSPN